MIRLNFFTGRFSVPGYAAPSGTTAGFRAASKSRACKLRTPTSVTADFGSEAGASGAGEGGTAAGKRLRKKCASPAVQKVKIDHSCVHFPKDFLVHRGGGARDRGGGLRTSGGGPNGANKWRQGRTGRAE